MATQSGTRLGHTQRGSMMAPPVTRWTTTTQAARRHGGVRCLNECAGRVQGKVRVALAVGCREGKPAGAESPFDKPQRYSHPHGHGPWLCVPSIPTARTRTRTRKEVYAPPASSFAPAPSLLRRLPSSPACAAAWHSIVNTRPGREDASLGCAVYAPWPRMHRIDAATGPGADAPTRLAINPIALGHEALRSVQGAEKHIHQLCVIAAAHHLALPRHSYPRLTLSTSSSIPHYASRRHPQQNPSPRGEGLSHLLPAEHTAHRVKPVQFTTHSALHSTTRPGCSRPHVHAINPPSAS
ncbi:hypothetical protein COCC4DRAFT_24495 [Bipolaris maydis ATCC 48331]|uniref:Uncharacterized protein n=2 Tax=Cochliobolus heterostrophus TaxID=5016 RepID=M2TKL9_COCH5|nr:uncharacterized protein COCC4DRAFT_24495 [Bipolaris maydis ATCC 48331]EMD87029.1 hypothetical protein COCHEDRAFT_1034239 [Bipolaris maydis C5]ENI03978.1 hypothetical protein COCC4DRAFT_24495 [Bipolaris maydis ATCC 48331]